MLNHTNTTNRPLPNKVAFNPGYCHLTYPIFLCNHSLPPIIYSNFMRPFPRQLVRRMELALVFNKKTVPSLCNHICQIIGPRTKKQMVWANTLPIITMMQDAQPKWDFSKTLFPNKARHCLSAHSNPLSGIPVCIATVTYTIPATSRVNIPNNRPMLTTHTLPPIIKGE